MPPILPRECIIVVQIADQRSQVKCALQRVQTIRCPWQLEAIRDLRTGDNGPDDPAAVRALGDGLYCASQCVKKSRPGTP